MLDRRFFQQVSVKGYDSKGGFLLESFKAVYARSTMVLFSRKSHTPLAALTLKTDDVGCLAMLTGRPSPGDAPERYFQGMLNMPEQNFSFTISNLSNEGMINFNVLHTPHRVSTVDPGPAYGINQVNELHKNQSYTIEADQRNNRKMILAGKTKQGDNHEQVAVTVKESEQEENRTGLYFYLSVVPDKACSKLDEKFAEGTVWKVVPGFVRKIAKPQPPPPPPQWILDAPTRLQTPSYDFFRGSPAVSLSSSSAPSTYAARGAQASAAPRRRAGIPGSFFSFGSNSNRHASRDTSRVNGVSLSGFSRPSSAPPAPSFGPAEPPQARSLFAAPDNARSQPHAPSMPPAPPCGLVATAPPGSDARPQSRAFRVANDEERNDDMEIDARFSEPVDVGSTQAAQLGYGARVNVRSGYSGHDYAYELNSEPTVLCMSIWEGMKFLPLVDIEAELAKQVQDLVENEGKALIESLNAVFSSETCVVDLESEPDTIICTCGHQCVNHVNVVNLRKCPLCRSPISAFVRSDGIVVG